MIKEQEMQVVVLWEQIIHELLDISSRFPKFIRPVVTHRLLNYCFDVLDYLVSAQYSSTLEQEVFLQQANLHLTKIRFLLRISCQEQWLSEGRLIALNEKIDQVGKGIYGWKKSLPSV